MLMNSLVSAVSSLRPRQQGYHDYIFGKNKIFIVVCFLLGDSPASEMYMPTFRNTLFHLPAYEDGTDRVFRNVGIYISEAGVLLGDSPASEMYIPTFRNTVPSTCL